jgi:hypothetical protein
VLDFVSRKVLLVDHGISLICFHNKKNRDKQENFFFVIQYAIFLLAAAAAASFPKIWNVLILSAKSLKMQTISNKPTVANTVICRWTDDARLPPHIFSYANRENRRRHRHRHRRRQHPDIVHFRRQRKRKTIRIARWTKQT